MENQILHCQGCGVKIQTENKTEIGYAPPSALDREVLICQRCFRLKHYNEIQDVSLTDDDFLKILNGIGDSDALVVKIVDIFDFNGSWLPGLHRFVGKNKVLLVGNKVDLLPKSVKNSKLIHWMKYSASQLGLKPKDVYLISAAKGEGVQELAAAIDFHREGKNVYVVGCTNVGKSTFINKIIKEFSGVTDDVITTSQFPGTTLDLIDIPLDDGTSLFDTPGLINHHQMAHFVNEKGLKMISPRKEIKPRVFQLNEGQTLYFGGLARFDYISGGRKSFTCYVSNELNIHRTKLEKADKLYEDHVGELLFPPFEEEVKEFPPLVKQEFMIREAKTDIVFHGLGWVTCNEPGAKIVAHVPKGVGVTIRQSLI
ncbi:ribosome biogenesis GTPase YqeH [Schinkia azotoformans]|uniref:ribosome biogenesis GTPase YqeH n=1 Tax=Schinkia azotoformans TaxID=1454 RepID=UPI002DB847C7|nr:ribosome biogenesis GTPase YqeH [Schinkia azotoformans]MEC1696667.1 ribosome biogenesis GTPase YqeH [Schinkia azotoformans]MEC1726141.1 ribosome biogenesis GTPase YqeH [Schinkia azotoformans]MEC1781122.1 ribosome biogenesis GTPase YqeH [Schinkia azotoformans]MED4329299.1 ribosome biogenesis GTPase YqeH [Schinkia azotoformans]